MPLGGGRWVRYYLVDESVEPGIVYGLELVEFAYAAQGVGECREVRQGGIKRLDRLRWI